MTRIKSSNIQLGESFILPIEKNESDKLDSQEAKKLIESLSELEQEIENAKSQKVEILKQTEEEAKVLIENANAQIQAEKQKFEEEKLQAEKQLEEFKKQAEAEAEQLKEDSQKQGYATGYDNGYNQGYAQIKNDLEQKIIGVDRFAQSQFDLKKNIIKSAELDIINLVIEIAKKVCTKSVELNPQLLEAITVSAIKALKDKEEIKIIVNPKLTEILNSVSDKIKEEIPQLKNIKIIEDSNVSADGTIVESILTRVDSRITAQINELAEKMMTEYNSEDIEEYLVLQEEDAIENISDIQLSDDANILEFLEELESINYIEDKLSEEEVRYYDNIDLDELKTEEELQQQNSLMENVNVDHIDEFSIDELTQVLQKDRKPEINTSQPILENKELPQENSEQKETFNSINEESLESTELQENISNFVKEKIQEETTTIEDKSAINIEKLSFENLQDNFTTEVEELSFENLEEKSSSNVEEFKLKELEIFDTDEIINSAKDDTQEVAEDDKIQ